MLHWAQYRRKSAPGVNEVCVKACCIDWCAPCACRPERPIAHHQVSPNPLQSHNLFSLIFSPMTFKTHTICSRLTLLAGGARHRSAKVHTYVRRFPGPPPNFLQSTSFCARIISLGNCFEHIERHMYRNAIIVRASSRGASTLALSSHPIPCLRQEQNLRSASTRRQESFSLLIDR